MARGSIARVAEQRRRESDPNSERFVDLQLDFVSYETDELLERLGGRWDRRAHDWTPSDAPRSMRLPLHEGQIEKFAWFSLWLDGHLAGDVDSAAKIYSAMFAGGRRGGKTHLGVACCVAYAVTVPDSIVWIVCPTDKHFEEIQTALDEMMPRGWFEYLGAPWWRYSLANGSRIVLRSAHNPNTLKKGRVDFALLNEGQQMKESAFTTVRAAISDVGGMCLVACNPPDDGDVGTWVGDFAVEAEEGRRRARYFFFDPLDNPFIDVDALLALTDEMDPHTFDIQVRGMFLSPRDAVFYNWDRKFNERSAPQLGDITPRFTRSREAKAFEAIVSIDVQRHPHMVAAIWKIFANPEKPNDLSRAFAWCVDEVVLEGGDEYDVSAALLERGFDPESTLIILDASGWWQTAATAGKKIAKQDDASKYKAGRGSFHILRECGWPHVKRPDRKMKKNPDGVERARATCARIGTTPLGKKQPQRYLFCDPKCRTIAKAFRGWKNKTQRPDRNSEHAHSGDTITYFVWRFWPRRRKQTDAPGASRGTSKGGKRARTKRKGGLKSVY